MPRLYKPGSSKQVTTDAMGCETKERDFRRIKNFCHLGKTILYTLVAVTESREKTRVVEKNLYSVHPGIIPRYLLQF
jgi:hypothetical protein